MAARVLSGLEAFFMRGEVAVEVSFEQLVEDGTLWMPEEPVNRRWFGHGPRGGKFGQMEGSLGHFGTRAKSNKWPTVSV